MGKFYFVYYVENWSQQIDMNKFFTFLIRFYVLKMKTIQIKKYYWLDLYQFSSFLDANKYIFKYFLFYFKLKSVSY